MRQGQTRVRQLRLSLLGTILPGYFKRDQFQQVLQEGFRRTDHKGEENRGPGVASFLSLLATPSHFK